MTSETERANHITRFPDGSTSASASLGLASCRFFLKEPAEADIHGAFSNGSNYMAVFSV
jgi:hypothetical protein